MQKRFNFLGLTAHRVRFAMLSLLVALTCCTASFFAQTESEKRTKSDKELALIASWMHGTYDTFAQVERDERANTAYKHVRAVMHLAPVVIAGLNDDNSSKAFYIEQALAEAQDKPYRQRVYYVTRLDGKIVNRTYKIKDPAQFVGGYRQPELLKALTLDRIMLEEGCDLVWTRTSDNLYRGVAGKDKRCKTTVRGATHTISQVEITPNTITSLDQGFDDAGAHKWGPPPGVVGHTFVRRMK